MREATATAPAAAGWLRGPWFDSTFILGITAVALLSGAIVVAEPALFFPILMADLWLLGYHHVIATYTRLCFDRESFQRHRFMMLGLPWIVFACVAAAGATLGFWVLATTYFYWQWFHYTRQSWGVSQIYRRNAGDLVDDNDTFLKIAFYALPVWGILHRSWQDPGTFLGMELVALPTPAWAVHAAAAVTVLSLAWWIFRRVVALWQGRLAFAHTLYLATHFLVFAVGYVVIEDITFGWLVINIWHNAQYLFVVWLYNNNRFKDGVDGNARFLSFISQSRNVWIYLIVCVGLSSALYFALENSLALLIAPIVIYQTINFHHYIVDSYIWKVRRKSVRERLGVAD